MAEGLNQQIVGGTASVATGMVAVAAIVLPSGLVALGLYQWLAGILDSSCKVSNLANSKYVYVILCQEGVIGICRVGEYQMIPGVW